MQILSTQTDAKGARHAMIHATAEEARDLLRDWTLMYRGGLVADITASSDPSELIVHTGCPKRAAAFVTDRFSTLTFDAVRFEGDPFLGLDR